MKTLEERIKAKKKSLLKQSIAIFVGGNLFGFQFYRVAKNYEVVNINNIQEVMNKVILNIKTDPFFIPVGSYYDVLVIVGLMAIGYFMIRSTNIKKYMKEDGYGSSRWAKKYEIAELGEKKYNLLLADKVKLSTNARKTKINNNVLLVGTSGSGKTRFYIKPNLMESALNNVFDGIIVTDPKGELLIETASMMEKHGYTVKVFDIKNWKGNHWNPFNYFEKDVDILSFVNSLVENTNKGQKGGDPFWDNAAMLLFNSIFFYLKEKCIPDDRNLINVKRLINLATVSEDNEDYESTLDIMMKELEKENANSKAVEFYKSFKKASGKTLKSIIITALSRLNFIGLDEVDQMLSYDDMNIQDIGYKKTVLYICIPDDDSSFNFLSGMFIDQLFRVLIRKADKTREKPFIHFFLDEFANIGKLNYFCEKISTIRSRHISTTLVVQNTQQIENLYKGQEKVIIENCNTKLVLGTSECTKWVSEKLGTMTIDTKTTGGSKGKNASSNYNNNQMKRNLLDPNEVEQLPKDKCIIMCQGMYPILANKYKIETHKLYKELGDVNEDNKNNFEFIPTNKTLKNTLIEQIKKVETINEEKLMEELVNDLSSEIDGIENDLEELGEELDQEFSNIVNN